MLYGLARAIKTRAKQLNDMRSIMLYLFVLVAIAITWSSVKTIQNNYQLQKQISRLQQENAVIGLRNQNTALRNQYLQTDQYLELAARQSLGLAAPGEKVLLIPKNVSAKYLDPSLTLKSSSTVAISTDNRSKYVKNMEAWRDFLLGRKVVID
jgi:cell division protein FtsB